MADYVYTPGALPTWVGDGIELHPLPDRDDTYRLIVRPHVTVPAALHHLLPVGATVVWSRQHYRVTEPGSIHLCGPGAVYRLDYVVERVAAPSWWTP